MPAVEERLPVDTIEDTIKAFKDGEFVLVLDSPTRENEGDLIIAADAMTPAKMAFLIRHSSGIVCAPLPPTLCDALELPLMLSAERSTDPHGTAYTLSIDAAHTSTTTGVSASDRSLTCTLLGEEAAKMAKAAAIIASPTPSSASASASSIPTDLAPRPEAFRRPGHLFPLRARNGGVLERQGHTEAALDLCRLSGRAEAGVISELVDDGVPSSTPDGRLEPELHGAGMMRGPACVEFARRWGLRMCTIEDLVEYRLRTEGGNKAMVNGKQ